MDIIISNKLKDILDDRGVKQTWLADKLNISKATVSNIINNRYNTSLETACKMALILNLKLEDIFVYKKV